MTFAGSATGNLQGAQCLPFGEQRHLAAQILETITLDSNKNFQKQYTAAGGRNGTFNFPPTGTHGWGYWGSQLAAMKGDIQRTLGT